MNNRTVEKRDDVLLKHLERCVQDVLDSGRTDAMVDALLVSVYDRGVPRRDAANGIAVKVLCLLDVCPMSPKRMGELLGIDAEVAVFKNALTKLRRLGMVEASGPKHARMYRSKG